MKIILLSLMFFVFKSVAMYVDYAYNEILLSTQNLVLLLASYASLLNTSFLLLSGHRKASAWPSYYMYCTLSFLFLFYNASLCYKVSVGSRGPRKLFQIV